MPDDALLDQLDRLAIELVGMTASALNESGALTELTLAQWRALALVASSTGMRASDLADRMGMSRPSVSRLVRRLVRKGLIHSAVDHEDGRAVSLRSTEAGRLILVETRSRRRQLFQEALSRRAGPLPADVAAALGEVADVLVGSPAPAEPG